MPAVQELKLLATLQTVQEFNQLIDGIMQIEISSPNGEHGKRAWRMQNEWNE